MTNVCIACGRHMLNSNQHAMGDMEKPYCVFCARPDGSMHSYEETLDRMTDYYLHTEPVDRYAATEMAKERLAALPAWSKEVALK